MHGPGSLTFEDVVESFLSGSEPAARALVPPVAADSVRKPAKAASGQATGKVISCEECGQIFKHRSSLREHRRKHSNETPFECPHPGCKLRFKWRSSLSNHKRYHQPRQNPSMPVKGLCKPVQPQSVLEDCSGVEDYLSRVAQSQAPRVEKQEESAAVSSQVTDLWSLVEPENDWEFANSMTLPPDVCDGEFFNVA